jgi:hypothetical protein
MARSTITEDIARLEAELSRIRTKIEASEAFRALEEGSASARFRTEFTAIETLYQREAVIVARLETLYNYQARF